MSKFFVFNYFFRDIEKKIEEYEKSLRGGGVRK
jgi:hypothetical protein